jgi:hypothetical protein
VMLSAGHRSDGCFSFVFDLPVRLSSCPLHLDVPSIPYL